MDIDYTNRKAAERLQHTIEFVRAAHEHQLTKEEKLSVLGVAVLMGVDNLVAAAMPEELGAERDAAIKAADQFGRLLHSLLIGFVTQESEKEMVAWFVEGCPPRTNRKLAQEILNEIKKEEQA